MEDDSDSSQTDKPLKVVVGGGDLMCSTRVIHWVCSFFLFCDGGETYVCAEMAVVILLSLLAVTWLIILKQLDEAAASLMAQLKYGQAD